MAGKVIKLETGTVYQKTINGSYYFRYQVNGRRKAVSIAFFSNELKFNLLKHEILNGSFSGNLLEPTTMSTWLSK